MRRTTAITALALVLTACGGQSDTSTTVAATGPLPADAFAFAASSDLAVGHERLLVALSDEQGTRLPSPDIPVSFRVWPEGDEQKAIEVAADFMWAIENVSGLYRATIDFDQPGIWEVEVTPVGGPALAPFLIQVNQHPATIGVGDPAPLSDTLTLDDAPIEQISSATDPDPSFYELSIAEAVQSGRPTVIVFATPKFCQTAICGPTLDRVMDIAPDHPEADFVHVEVFDLADTSTLTPVPAVFEWGLPSEPWVFVVDADGIVTARFEGVVTPEEITAALAG